MIVPYKQTFNNYKKTFGEVSHGAYAWYPGLESNQRPKA